MRGSLQFVKAAGKKRIAMGFLAVQEMEKSSAVVSIIPPADWEKMWVREAPRGTAHVRERLKARP